MRHVILGIVAFAVFLSTAAIAVVGGQRAEPDFELPQAKFVNEFQNGLTEVKEYAADNRDGRAVERVVQAIKLAGGKHTYTSEHSATYRVSTTRTVSVYLEPKFLAVVGSKWKFQSPQGKIYYLAGASASGPLPVRRDVQVIVCTAVPKTWYSF